jgi:hypothetical protein
LHWSFDATANGQPADDSFAEPLWVRVSAKPLIERGIDLALVNLLTREQFNQEWSYLSSEYDATRQEFVARLRHFSEFGLSIDGTSNYALPSMNGLTNDLQRGDASYSIAIESPSGVGGLNPNLSLHYSQFTVNDVMMSDGNFKRKTQASMVGYGWSLGGVNSIADCSRRGPCRSHLRDPSGDFCFHSPGHNDGYRPQSHGDRHGKP